MASALPRTRILPCPGLAFYPGPDHVPKPVPPRRDADIYRRLGVYGKLLCSTPCCYSGRLVFHREISIFQLPAGVYKQVLRSTPWSAGVYEKVLRSTPLILKKAMECHKGLFYIHPNLPKNLLNTLFSGKNHGVLRRTFAYTPARPSFGPPRSASASTQGFGPRA